MKRKLAPRPLNTIFTSWSFGLKNKQARGDYLVKMVKKTQGLRPVDHLVPYRNDSYLTNPHIECVKFSWLVLFFYNKVSSLVTMYSHLGDVNAAVAVLDDAVEFAQKNKVSKEEYSWVVHLSQSWQPLRFFINANVWREKLSNRRVRPR